MQILPAVPVTQTGPSRQGSRGFEGFGSQLFRV